MKQDKKRHQIEKWLLIALHVSSLLPLVRMVWAALRGTLGFNPVETTMRQSGRTAVTLLLLSLTITPLQVILNLPALVRVRKPLGLYAALYAGLHFAAFAIWDYGLNLILIWREFSQKPYLLLGLGALLILTMLAITSTRGWRIKLRSGWRWLQRTVYLAAVLAMAHYLLAVKGDLFTLQGNYTRPLITLIVLLILFLLRLPFIYLPLKKRLGHS